MPRQILVNAENSDASSTGSQAATPTQAHIPTITPNAPGPSAPSWRQSAAPASRPPNRNNIAAARQSVAPAGSMLRSVLNTNALNLLPKAMGGLNFNERPMPPSDVFDPSMGPDAPQPSIAPRWQGSACPTENSTGNYNVDIWKDSCVRRNRHMNDFQKGEVLALPHHEPNLSPRNDWNHRRVAKTCEGPTFSKRRMFVVLHKYEQDMLCLPLYTYEDRGIGHKPESIKREHVCVKNYGAVGFENVGYYDPVEIRTYYKKRMKEMSTISLTGGIKFNVSEDISFVGRLTEESYEHVLMLYNQRNQASQRKGWEPDVLAKFARGNRPQRTTGFPATSRAASSAHWGAPTIVQLV